MFSGISQAYECTNCGRSHTALLPTSVIPMAAITLASGQFWGKVLSHFTASLFTAYAAGIVIAALILIAGILVISRFSYRWLNTMQCEQCGHPLKGVGSGVVSDTMPSRGELLVYILALSIPLGAWFIMLR